MPGDPSPDADPSGSPPTDVRGAHPETVRLALASGDPLPGTAGFAGAVDGVLVRDVLGRQPVFVEAAPSTDGPAWTFDPAALADPEPLGAGLALDLRVDSPDPADVERAWSLPNPEPTTDPEAAIEAVRRAVRESTGTVDSDGLAVAFSGGVDSALVAAGVPDAPCYVAGFEGSHDVAAARETAAAFREELGRDVDLRVVAFDHADIRRAVPRIVAATGRSNAMDVQIALPLYFVAEAAAADGHERLAVGQGADELFGGYSKVVNPADDHRVEADTVRGATREVIETLPAQLTRDVLTLRAAGVEPVAPLLHDRVVDAALRLPPDLLATEDERKIALRRAAEDLVPETARSAEKKAVQYGTYAARELDRLARQAGFKRRMDDHVDRYVRALVDDAVDERPTE